MKAAKLESEPSGKEKLEAALIKEIIYTIEHQLDAMTSVKQDATMVDKQIMDVHLNLESMKIESGKKKQIEVHQWKHTQNSVVVINSGFDGMSESVKSECW